MAVTAAGTPYVESSDLVANYPGVSLALANHIDTSTGKVLQVVRATDSTRRTTTSTSFVDVTGMSVTITPQKITNSILLISVFNAIANASSGSQIRSQFQITNSSNTAISGAENADIFSGTTTQFYSYVTLMAFDSPNTLSATTYKTRFKTLQPPTTTEADNASNTGQMYAIEVAV